MEPSAAIRRNGLMFAIPKQGEPLPETKPGKAPKEKVPRVKPKNDPRLIAAARELRDRWLEQVNADPSALLSHGKYDVSSTLRLDSTELIEVRHEASRQRGLEAARVMETPLLVA